MKKYFLKDKSLSNIDDDQFRYQDYANNLQKIIECNEVPFNVAIIGKWGLGKSSLINIAFESLERKKEFLICKINAWKYEKDEIGKAFLKELWETIEGKRAPSFYFFHKDYSKIIEELFKKENENTKKNKKGYGFLIYAFVILAISVIAFTVYCYISNNFYGIDFKGSLFVTSTILRYCKNIGSILIMPIIIGLGTIMMNSLNGSLHEKYEISFPLVTQADYEIYLKNLLDEYYKKNPKKKILVIIDDLDRLSADKIVEALDALKLFMEYDRFVFVVPFDDEILKNALRKRRIDGISTFGSEYDGEMVLDKIFQYKIYLPQLIKYDMRNYAFEICKTDCSDFVTEYCNDNYKLFEDILGKILIHSGVSTPRQVKKIVNTFVENVMIARDREQAGKVGEGFATEKVGLQTIAKISVLQSDYNEFYDLLFKDVSVINEILEVHRGDGGKEPSELLKNYFDDKYVLERKYKPLVDYLIFTENLGHSNITPYLYMSQTKEGVLVGDQKQQDFMAAIESCNFVSVKQMITETPILISLFLEQLRYNESLMMGNIILSAIDCYDIVLEEDKGELAVAIVERIPELSKSSSDFRYDLINEKNLIEVCHKANSNEYNNLIECAINSNRQDGNYKNRVILVNKISEIKHELSDDTLNKVETYTKEWMKSDESRVQDIIDYAMDSGIEYTADTYGKEYVQRITKHITENDDFEDSLIEQFGNIIREFLRNNSFLEIIDILEPCYDYPILHKMLDESIDAIKYKEIQDAIDIAMKIVSMGVKKLKGVYAYRILSKLTYEVVTEEGEIFDAFFVDTIGEIEFADMMEAFAENNILGMLPKTIERLIQCAFENEGYEQDIRRLLKMCTDEQANEVWKKFKNLCSYSSSGKYEIVSSLIVELSKDSQYDEEVITIIENDIISGVISYYNRNDYFLFAIQVVNAYKDKISQSNVDRYSSALIKALSTDTNTALNAYRVVNELNSKDFWCKNLDTILKYVSKGTYAIIYDIITGRIKLFNKENNNLNQLAGFMIDYIDLSNSPNDVINTLSAHFTGLGTGKVGKLIHMLMSIEYDEDNASTKLAKFIDTESIEEIVKIISDESDIDEAHKEKLARVLSKSKRYSRHELIYRIDEEKENINKNDILFILEFCEGAITENNIKAFVNIMRYLLKNYLEKDVCTQIILRISNIPKDVMGKQRDGICNVLIQIFRESPSDENRRKSSIVIKDKGFGRKIKSILDENELKEYRSYLS